jgi:hypothetical protein
LPAGKPISGVYLRHLAVREGFRSRGSGTGCRATFRTLFR